MLPRFIHHAAPSTLTYREVFAGFRPKLLLTRTSVPGLVVTAHVAPPGPPDPHPVWRTYSVQQLAQQYSPRSQVPDVDRGV